MSGEPQTPPTPVLTPAEIDELNALHARLSTLLDKVDPMPVSEEPRSGTVAAPIATPEPAPAPPTESPVAEPPTATPEPTPAPVEPPVDAEGAMQGPPEDNAPKDLLGALVRFGEKIEPRFMALESRTQRIENALRARGGFQV